ncbi:MAG TPA: alpha-L-fucosidase [Candidatus Dormibacteraeota bacterium]|nr:alpha-L-fucosidase [Candidatus Dormibacteraeota bacterium]
MSATRLWTRDCGLWALLLLLPSNLPAADTGDPHDGQKLVLTDSAAQVAKRLDWWSDARFGMFIHWGLYAQDGCFWKGQDGKTEHMMRHLQIPILEYEKIATEFNPVKFNALEWVKIAKDAGMKYMIITSKHHDGFAMFNSKSNPFNIVGRTPFKRDPIKELAEACRAQGLKFGVYYSLGRDWHDPDVPTKDGYRSNTWDFPDESKKDFSKYFERKVKPQVTELLTQYGPIAVMWFDTPEKISKSQSQELVALIHKLQPDCIINARVGNRLGDYAVQEQKIPAAGDPQPWETCMTLNGHWGYNKTDHNWKPTEKLVRNLIDVASKGGNFLLNVGPTGEGIISEPSVERLKEVGQWLKVNGVAIYGTTAGPIPQPAWGRCTRRTSADGQTLFLHVFDWPSDGKLLVKGIKDRCGSASLLASGDSVPVTSSDDGMVLKVPTNAPDGISSTIVMRLQGTRQP